MMLIAILPARIRDILVDRSEESSMDQLCCSARAHRSMPTASRELAAVGKSIRIPLLTNLDTSVIVGQVLDKSTDPKNLYTLGPHSRQGHFKPTFPAKRPSVVPNIETNTWLRRHPPIQEPGAEPMTPLSIAG